MTDGDEQSIVGNQQSYLPARDAVNACKQASCPWYRLHVSTCIALLPIVAVFFLLNVPGSPTTHAFSKRSPSNPLDFGLGTHFEHGWPWSYLSRDRENESSSIIVRVGSSVWHVSEEVEYFSLWVLLADVATCGIIAAVVVGILELRRRRRSRIWQVSVKDLFVGIALCAAALGYVFWQYREYQRERQAIDALLGNDDGVEQNGPSGGYRITSNGLVVWQSGLPRWFTEQLNELPASLFDRAVYARVEGWEAADVALLQDLPRLEVIDLSGSLGGMRSNEVQVERGFIHSEQSDGTFTRAMQGLRGVKNLRALHLGNSDVSDAALDVIADFPAIEVLDLGGQYGVNIGVDGLKHVSRMKNLRVLYLKDLNQWFLSDSTVPLLAGIPRLEVLWLSSRDVTDQSLAYLAKLTELRELDLSGTSITGKELPRLERLRHLETLVVPKAAEMAAKKLQQSMPGLTVAVE